MQEEPPPNATEQPATVTEPPTQRQSVMFDVKKSNSLSKMPKLCSNSANPITALMHIILITGVVFLYFALPMLTKPSNAFALIILASAIDFYFIKNIAGRKLVGMRWWIEFTQDGREITRFECRMDERSIPSASVTIFWYPFYIFSVVWFVLIIINVITLNWPQIFICVFNLVLIRYNANLFGECSTKKTDQVEQMIGNHGYQEISQYYKGTLVSQVRGKQES